VDVLYSLNLEWTKVEADDSNVQSLQKRMALKTTKSSKLNHKHIPRISVIRNSIALHFALPKFWNLLHLLLLIIIFRTCGKVVYTGSLFAMMQLCKIHQQSEIVSFPILSIHLLFPSFPFHSSLYPLPFCSPPLPAHLVKNSKSDVGHTKPTSGRSGHSARGPI